MNGSELNRFAILLMLFGGFLQLTGAINGYGGIPSYGIHIMFLALVLGLFALFFTVLSAVYPSNVSEE